MMNPFESKEHIIKNIFNSKRTKSELRDMFDKPNMTWNDENENTIDVNHIRILLIICCETKNAPNSFTNGESDQFTITNLTLPGITKRFISIA